MALDLHRGAASGLVDGADRSGRVGGEEEAGDGHVVRG
jgi:hypothetical protein